MDNVIVNRVAESALTTVDLEDFYPKEEIAVFDLKSFLFMELILREKDYREALKNLDWSIYQNKIVAVTCSADAIIPVWAYMLTASYLQPIAKEVLFGTVAETRESILIKNINNIDNAYYIDKRIVVKGCGEIQISEKAYLAITLVLRPVAKSIMYGEPCSTVPVFKAPIQR